MQHNTPAVSVCVPTYRGAAHLRAAIGSVLTQTFGDLELVIIDDNSPDDTADIVAACNDKRIRFLRNAINLGPQGNWNRCRDEARGRYFKLLPHDDVLAPDCLAHQVAVFEQDRDERIALVFGGRDFIDADGRKIMQRAAYGRRARSIPAQAIIKSCVRKGTNLIGEPGNVLLRRSLLERVGAFDATHSYMIDLDYWFRALRLGDAYYLPETLSAFRISAGSWSVAIGKQQCAQFSAFARKYAATPEYGIGRADLAIGKGMAQLNARLRQLVYRWLLRKA
jgi:glycosyltransferase involved in cell wall biosynthesis